ncbi:sulfonate ABC transporter substrate-binding protein [Actinomadura sp. NBRC 104412]|uniref:ABC transporter substrate-binding protein n=1 Tax=Actinomadura sp. NBRC 104412 TaxID=3032203 RepID=UPI0024A43B6B|nr:ABC transporter substrate-binding protein [Actinomadura sp. NBRC 104412]GLZ04673.1 sulfonate ABC transporter substrate-binding protein [Actinomadura sp. NBRC 104412]
MRQSGRSRRLSLVLGALALVTSMVTACGDSESSGAGDLEKDTVTVAALPLVDSAAIYIAQKQKLFEAEGLKVQIKPIAQSIAALPALAKGEVDFISGANYVSFLAAQEKGTLKLSIVAEAATLTPNMVNVVVNPDSPIKTMKDLEGKTIAVNILNNIQSLTLDAIFKANNIDPKKIKYVTVPFPQMGAALQKKQVDSASIVEPFLSDVQKKAGARVVVNGGAEPVTNMPLSGYVSTQDFTSKNPKTTAAFQRAIIKAQQIAASDRKRVEEVLPGYARIDPQVASVITLPGYPTSLNATRIQRVIDLMTAAGQLKQKPDVKSLLFQSTA